MNVLNGLELLVVKRLILHQVTSTSIKKKLITGVSEGRAGREVTSTDHFYHPSLPLSLLTFLQ